MTRTSGRRFLPLAAAIMAIAALAPDIRAQDAEDESRTVADDLRAVREEIQKLREDNQELRGEIDQLRAETTDDWLTEQRAEEIRGLVADVLADADVRASSLNSGMMAGWSEHFFLASPDGRFKLQFDGQVQFRWGYRYHDQADRHRHGFEISRTKLTLRGHLFNPNLTFMVRTDKTRNEPGLVEGLFFLRDAWVAYQFDRNWSFRLGLYKIPFSREELVSSSYQLAVERSLVNESLNGGRSEGIELAYATDTDKVTVMYNDGASDSVGGFTFAGGFPPNTSFLIEDVEWSFTARWERLIAGSWEQFKDFTSPPGDEYGMLFGFAAHYEKDEFNGFASNRRNEARWFAGTTDLSIEWGGANAFVSFVYHYVDAPNFNANIWGVVLQGGVYVAPKLEAFARWEYGWWDLNGVAEFHDLNLLTVGINWYIDGHDLKWTTDIGFGLGAVDRNWDSDLAGWVEDADGADPQIVFRTQFQLLF